MIAPKVKFALSRRSVKYSFAAIAIVLIAVAGWWMAGRKVWTNGQAGPSAIRVFTADEDPRQVLWTPSRPVLPPGFIPGGQTPAGRAEADSHLYEPALSPDGIELYYVRGKAGLPAGDAQDGQPASNGADIYVSRRENNAWSPPAWLDAINGRYDDLGPRMTADGRFLLFYSNRPGGQGGYDLWGSQRDDDGTFGPPFNLGAGVNSEFDEYGPAPSIDGKQVYFSTNRTAAGKEQHTAWRATIRAGTTTDFDLWFGDLRETAATPASETDAMSLSPPPVGRGRVKEGVAAEMADPFAAESSAAANRAATQPARPPRRTLQASNAREVPGVNTTFHEGAPCISPAGDFLYFASNRPEGHGKFDLYRSRLIAGKPADPQNLGPSVNTADNETDPQLAHGGFRLYYSSDRAAEEMVGWSSGGAAEEVSGWSGGGVARSPGDGRMIAGSGTGPAPEPQLTTAPPNHPNTQPPLPPPPLHRAYSLFEADSREVYPERQGRPLPVIGWKLLAMIAGTLLLLPLLFFLARNINRRNFTLLQRCFIAAMCVYALFLFWTTSKHVVMEAYPQLAKDLGLFEVKINLDPRIEESNVSMAIRQQSSNDLPVAAAPAGQLTQQVGGGDVIEAAPDVAVHVPQAAIGADAMTVVVAPPRMDIPKTAAPAASMVAPVITPTPQPVDIKVEVGPRLQQAEAAPMIQIPQAPAATPAEIAPRPARPVAVNVPDLPAARPAVSADSLVQEFRPVAPTLPQVTTPTAAVTAVAAAPVPGAGPAIQAPAPIGAKAAAAEPPAAQISGPVAPAIERLAGAGLPDAAPAANVTAAVPAAGAATGGAAQSLAAAPGVGAALAPRPAGVAGVALNLPAGELIRDPDVAGPMMETTPLAGGDPATPVIGPAQALGLSRQDVPTGNLAGGAGINNAQLPKLPTAGGGTPSLVSSPGPSSAANAVARMNSPQASIAPKPASGAVATSADVGNVTIQPPTTRPSGAEPSLASALDSAAGMQPTTRPVGAGAEAPGAAVAAIEPVVGPTAVVGIATLAPAPTTRPSGAAGSASDMAIAGPTIGPATSVAMVAADLQLSTPQAQVAPVAVATPQLNVGFVATPGVAKSVAAANAVRPEATGGTGIAVSPPPTPDFRGKADGSIASSAVVPPRAMIAAPAVPAPSLAGAGIGQAMAGIDGPQMALPKISGMPQGGTGQGAPAGVGAAVGGDPDGDRIAAARANGGGPAIDRPAAVVPAGVPGVKPRIGQGGVRGPIAVAGPRPGAVAATGLEISPNISVSAPKLGVPEALFQRSAEQRRPMIEKLGGTKESEDAVARGLAWLARMQEADGRWTYISGSGKRSRGKSQGVHDMGMTGLAVLAFLAADHSPTKEGPYQQVVASAVDWLVNQQTDDGDLRGAKDHRGAGAGRANMYDHGIATMAVAEAALMTGDRRYIDAAYKAANYICDTQHKKTGGWRYLPGESGDTSVFGWQILALHNAELLGFQTPDEVRERSLTFLSLVSSGKTKILAGYTPGQGATQPMTAEALFCRVLLGDPITDAQAKEVVAYLGREPPKSNNVDLYYWYYTSLSMAQLQANPQVRQAWDKWNARCRDTLIAIQSRGGDQDGSWMDKRWGDQGGKVYSTALATLTLEVYYRYLPVEPAAPQAIAAPAAPPADPPKKTRPRGPVGPKLEPN